MRVDKGGNGEFRGIYRHGYMYSVEIYKESRMKSNPTTPPFFVSHCTFSRGLEFVDKNKRLNGGWSV